MADRIYIGQNYYKSEHTGEEIDSSVEQTTTNKGDITSLKTRMTTAEGSITTQKGRIDALTLDASSVEGGVNVELKEVGGEVLTDVLIEPASLSSNGVMSKTQVKAISDNAGEIRTLKTRVTTAEGNITSLDNSLTEYVTDLTSAIEAVEAEYKAADTALGTRLTTAEGNIAEHTTKLSELQQRTNTNTNDIATLATEVVTANEIKEIMEELPDGQAVSAQVALNTTKISALDKNVGALQTDEAEVIKSIYSNDSYELPLLCGQPSILFGAGTPQEAVVPTNWQQFLDGGYNWNGTPSALGQQYINTSVTSGGRYIAVRDGNYGLKWLNC